MENKISGRRIGADWWENKPHLLNKLNYDPWNVPPTCERIAARFHN